jgi:hypothetical protein
MVLTAAGSVGIGTASPDGNLEVVGSQSTKGVHFKTGGGAAGRYILKASNYAGTEYFRIDSSGKVGIGTAAPACPFNVKSASAGNWLAILESTSEYGLKVVTTGSASSHDQFEVLADSVSVFKVWADGHGHFSGSVGIGTTAPDTSAGLTIKQPSLGAGVRCIGHDNTYAAYFGVGTSGYATVNALGDRGIILDADSVIICKTNDSEKFRVNSTGEFSYGGGLTEIKKSGTTTSGAQLDVNIPVISGSNGFFVTAHKTHQYNGWDTYLLCYVSSNENTSNTYQRTISQFVSSGTGTITATRTSATNLRVRLGAGNSAYTCTWHVLVSAY